MKEIKIDELWLHGHGPDGECSKECVRIPLTPQHRRVGRIRAGWDRFWHRYTRWYYGRWYRAAGISLIGVALGALVGQITKHL